MLIHSINFRALVANCSKKMGLSTNQMQQCLTKNKMCTLPAREMRTVLKASIRSAIIYLSIYLSELTSVSLL